MGPWIGRRQARVEDERFLRGRGRYTDDVRHAGEVFAAFVRSPVPHGRIVALDIEAAKREPGVLCVLTGADYRTQGLAPIDHKPNPADAVDPRQRALLDASGKPFGGALHWPLAETETSYIGEPLARVIAETAAAAEAAAERVRLEIEELPACLSVESALDDGANLLFDMRIGEAAAFARAREAAAHVVTHRFTTNRICNAQMEPRGAIGLFEDGAYTLVSGNQGVSRLQTVFSECLRVPAAHLRIVCPDVGGGFGPRTYPYSEQICVLWAARHVGRPVRWTSTRAEAFLTDYAGRDSVADATLCLDEQGNMLGYAVDFVSNIGAHSVAYVTAANAMRMLPTVYRVPALDGRVRGVRTHMVPTAPYRGAGRPEANHIMERMIDIAAARCSFDRILLRRRNLVRHEDLPYTTAAGLPLEGLDPAAYLEAALVAADVAGFAVRRADSETRGRLRGLGIANHLEAPVGAPIERVVLRIVDNRVECVVGTQSSGQGHETSFAQVVCDLLGVPFEDVRIIYGDTREVVNGGGTHSDRSLRYVATLARKAADRMIEAGRALAASLLQVATKEVHFVKGVFCAGCGGEIALLELARQAGGALAEPFAEEMFGRIPAFPGGCAVCEVEIDPETGTYEIARYTAVDDVGTIVNPIIVEGQAHGGIVQGLGQVMSEGMVHRDGALLTGSFMDYALPRASDVPFFEVRHMNVPTAGNFFGIKGGGEGGNVPVTSVVINALCDAIGGDVDDFDMPVTAPKVWRALRHRSKQ